MVEKKISEPSWFSKTTRALARSPTKFDSASLPRIALLGVGNELHGDDGAGVLVARRLRELLEGCSNLLIVEGGPAPENFSGPIRKFAPDWLIFLDIAQMDAEPGKINWFEMGEIDGVTAATHGLPVSMLASYLIAETGCRAGVLVVQPASLEFEAPLSAAVAKSVDELVERLTIFFLNPSLMMD